MVCLGHASATLKTPVAGVGERLKLIALVRRSKQQLLLAPWPGWLKMVREEGFEPPTYDM